VLRPYAIANAPRPDGELSLLVTRVPGGDVSTWLHEQAWPGVELAVSSPLGDFTAPPPADRPALFLAAAAGLAPVRAHVEAALSAGFTGPLTVLFSARTPDEVFCQGTFAYWERRHPNFRFVTTITQRATSDALHGRIPAVLSGLWDDLSGATVYVAGPSSFTDACAAAALRLGTDVHHLHTERYCRDGESEISAVEPATCRGAVLVS
jgi:CDP-4-dehydro-6-deoxyglucose reductase